jgi:TDG/mug DNA glycosylase family protein
VPVQTATLMVSPSAFRYGSPRLMFIYANRAAICTENLARAGRSTSTVTSQSWPNVRDVGFTRAELESFRDATLPDLLGPGLKLLFVGINPGLWTAAVQAHFSRRGNRFYPALYRAGITDYLIDASDGFREQDREHLLDRGIGITNLVARATARADELSTQELVDGGRTLERRVAEVGVRVVAVLGITAYRQAFALPKATAGKQPGQLGGAQLWVVPNPSGLNAHSTVASLADAYREVALAAGVPPVSATPPS